MRAVALRQFAPWAKVLRESLFAFGTGATSVLLGILALGINAGNISQRWQSNLAGDHVQHYLVARSAIQSALFSPNPQLGFPAAQNLFFAPNYDLTSAAILSIEGLFTSNPFLVLNLYDVLGFFSVGFAGYFLFRALRVRTIIAVLFALVFALAPYHFQRVSFGHSFVANYWSVALLGILLLMVASDATNPFARWIGAAPSASMRLARRIVPIVVLTLLVSLSLSYYFVFACILLAAVIFVRVVRVLLERRRWRSLAWPAVTLAALVGFIGIQLAVFSFNFDDRYSRYFSERSPEESEQHAGKITSLLLPWEGSGIAPLASISKAYAEGTTISPFGEPTGTPLVAALGMMLIVVFILYRVFASSRDTPTTAVARFLGDERAALLATAFLTGLLFFTVSGLGVIFAITVSAEIRAWVRLSIVLTMLALAFMALLLNQLVTMRRVLIPVLAFIAILATADQLAGVRTAINLDPTDDADLRAFVHDAGELLDPHCGVVQLPLKEYPATGSIGAMGDFEEALAYVVSDDSTLRWSYGAVMGTRSGDYWPAVDSVQEFADAVGDSAACAVMVDTHAYTSDVDAWRPLVESISTSDASITSKDRDHRYLLYTVDE